MQTNSNLNNKKMIVLSLLSFTILISVVGLYFPFSFTDNYYLFSYKDLLSLLMYIVSLVLVGITILVFSRATYKENLLRARMLTLGSIASFLLFLLFIDNFGVEQTGMITFNLGIGFFFFFLANVSLIIVVLVINNLANYYPAK